MRWGNEEISLFQQWLEEASLSEHSDPNAMHLASVDEAGMPNIRVVLMKDFGEHGLVFYTNFESAKGRELESNPSATLCFHWKTRQRCVFFKGEVKKVDNRTADAYFDSRPLDSRIGAWASQQSRPLRSKAHLIKRAGKYALKFGASSIPRPNYWGGFLLRPKEVEFWSGGELLSSVQQ